MNRRDAISALLSVQSKPVTKVESHATGSDRVTSGSTGAINYTPRVRDRMNASTATIVQPALSWEESAARERERAERIGAERNARRARDAAERRAKIERDRLRKIEDEKTLAAHREHIVDVTFQNAAKREVRQLLADEPADIITETARRVKEAGMQNLPFAWQAILSEVKREREEKKS